MSTITRKTQLPQRKERIKRSYKPWTYINTRDEHGKTHRRSKRLCRAFEKLGLALYEKYSKQTKRKTSIKKMSPRRQREQRELRGRIKARIAIVGDICEVGLSPNCNHQCEGSHHIKKRSQGGMKGPIVLCCIPCNGYIETHRPEAKAAGFVIETRDGLDLMAARNGAGEGEKLCT